MKETLQIPTPETLEALIGKELYDIWTSLCQLIEQKYNMEQLWNHGGKKWIYEYKYRKGGKTLCALYAKEQTIGFMVILVPNLNLCEKYSPMRLKRYTMRRLLSTMGSGLCSN